MNWLITVASVAFWLWFGFYWTKHGTQRPWLGWLYIGVLLLFLAAASFDHAWGQVFWLTLWIALGTAITRRDYIDHYYWKASKHD